MIYTQEQQQQQLSQPLCSFLSKGTCSGGTCLCVCVCRRAKRPSCPIPSYPPFPRLIYAAKRVAFSAFPARARARECVYKYVACTRARLHRRTHAACRGVDAPPPRATERPFVYTRVSLCAGMTERVVYAR